MVHVYDATNLFLINRQLADEYILDGDVATVCKHNAAAAAVVGRRDLVQAWTIAELTLIKRQTDDSKWSNHPCGDTLLTSLIEHYASQSDLQMAAMLCCMYGKLQADSLKRASLKSIFSPLMGGSPYHTIQADIVADGWVMPILKSARSTSLDNLRAEELIVPSVPPKIPYVALYEYYKMAYAETLNRWGLLYQRAEVMKFAAIQPEPFKGAEFIPDCQSCQTPTKHSVCGVCRKLPLHCVVCGLAARASVSCCLICGHGGHTDHLDMWFKQRNNCPLCGCHCFVETSYTFGY